MAESCFDVCIIGGGPGGLAALSACVEPYSLDQLRGDQADRAAHAYGLQSHVCPRVCVVDPEPWLTTWHKRFEALNIKWLRSPTGAHPDLFDANSLLAFAHNEDRTHELLESGAVTPSIQSLQEAHTGLWNLPSNQLFEDFCHDLSSRLPHTFVRAAVDSVEGPDGAFNVSLTDGRVLKARAVVLALGVPGLPAVPASLADIPQSLMFHSDAELGARLTELDTKEHVLVIGGGLTAVQVAQLAVKKGCKVTLCSRRPLTTRHFDVGASWFDRRRAPLHHFKFFESPIEERLASIKAARGGGSVPPMYMEELRKAQAEGNIELKCGDVTLKALVDDAVEVVLDGEVRRFDVIVNACGHRPDCQLLPLIRELQSTSPVEIVGGFPTLSQDLQWGRFKHLFVIGALASLQVGPDAGNLMGLRRAAQIMANTMDIRAWLKDTKSVLRNIRGNRFAALSDSESDSESDSQVSTAALKSSGGSSDTEDRDRSSTTGTICEYVD